jgi:hypothetical protein
MYPHGSLRSWQKAMNAANHAPRPRRRRLSKRKVLIALALPVGLIVLATRGKEETTVVPVAAPVKAARVTDCAALPFKHHSGKLKDKLPAYKHLSLKAGIRPLKDDEALQKTLAAGGARLVRIDSDARMLIAPMDHGSPYLTASAAETLGSIAQDFHACLAGSGLEGTRIRVNSLLRTKRDQRNLGRSNVNATRDENAPHTHGTSMDLSYMKFAGADGAMLDLRACEQVFLAETLAEVIAEHCARDSRIFATKEKQQACYHISVCR